MTVTAFYSTETFSQQSLWTRIYNPFNIYETAWAVCATSDSSFVLVGSNSVAVKIDKFGDVIWSKRYSGLPYGALYCCAPTSDGGCIFSGEASSCSATKIDADGNIVWHSTYPGLAEENTKIISDQTGQFIMIGNSAGVGYATKFNSLGELTWSKTFVTGLVSVLNSHDSGYLFVGSISYGFGDTSRLYLAKTDLSGNYKWERVHTVFNGGVSTQAADVMGNGYIVGGTKADTNGMFQSVSWIARISESGDIEHSRQYHNQLQEYFSDLKSCSDNRFVLVSRIALTSNNAKAVLCDGNGNILMSRVWESASFNSFRAVIRLSDNNLLFAGRWQYGPENDIFASQTDSLLDTKPLHIFNSNAAIDGPQVELSQNFPNPLYSSTVIRYTVRQRGHIIVNLIDATGRILYRIADGFRESGGYELKIEDLQIPSGCYFIQLLFNGRVSLTNRIVLLK